MAFLLFWHYVLELFCKTLQYRPQNRICQSARSARVALPTLHLGPGEQILLKAKAAAGAPAEEGAFRWA